MADNATQFQDVYQSKEEVFDWALYWQAIWSERRLILIVTGVFFLAATIVYSLIPNTYQAEVQILVEQTQGAEQMSTQSVTTTFRGEDDYYGTQIAIMTSSKITEQLEADLGLSAGSYQLSARRLRGTRIIVATVKSKKKEMAAQIANKAVEIYTKEKAQDDLFIAQQMLKWLPADVGEMDSGAVSQIPPIGDKARREEVINFFSSVANDPLYQKLKNEKLSLESQMRDLSARYKPGHPAMLELTQKLEFADAQIKEQRDKIVENLKSSFTGEFHLTNIKILSAAATPLKPISPKRVPGILLYTLLGFALGSFYVLYQEKTDQHIWYDSDLPESVSKMFMGYVPEVQKLTSLKHKHEPSKNSEHRHPFAQDVMRENPLLADAVAFMRTHLLFSVPYEKGKFVMITSSVPNEGKSTVSSLLALSLASIGRKTVIVDSDLRRSFLHHHLGVKNEKGLSDYLENRCNIDSIIKPVPESNLCIVTGGTPKHNPVHLLSSTNNFGQFLEELGQKFERVIVDVPPILYIPDSLMVAKYIHTAVLVVGTGMIRRRALQMVKQKFDIMNRNIAGVVINRVDYMRDVRHYKYFKAYKDYYAIDK